MGNVFQVFQHTNWVRAGEHFALRVGSLLFSMVSAHAILWFYDSLAKVDNSDPIQIYVPYVIAGGFGLLGYFVSRGLVYRLMHKERIRVYIAISALFEFVEIVCNFAQAVSSVPKVGWLAAVQGELHGILLVLLYVAYSIVPVVTFVLAVVDMDLEKAKFSTLRPGVAPGGYRPAVAPVAAARTYGAPAAAAAQPRQLPQPQARAAGSGKSAQAPASSSGWKFPFPRSANGVAGAGQNGANGATPVVVE
jgi:hypothetical protein